MTPPELVPRRDVEVALLLILHILIEYGGFITLSKASQDADVSGLQFGIRDEPDGGWTLYLEAKP